MHLENAARWPTVQALCRANGVRVPAHLSAGSYGFRGFSDFFVQNELVRACLCRASDFRRIAIEFCEDETAQGTRHAEVTFTAVAHGQRLGDVSMPLVAVLEGLAEGRARYGIDVLVVLDHSRRRSVEQAARTLDLATTYQYQGVVAVGLAGDESYPLEPFVKVFREARSRGLHITHHAGEALGPRSIVAAIQDGNAERIGHGITAVQDQSLIEQLREQDIALEVCPSSNVALGFAPSLATHPIADLVDAGVAVTINTDIPSMIGTTLTMEYERVRDAFGYDDGTMARFASASVDASWARASVKDDLHQAIESWLLSPY